MKLTRAIVITGLIALSACSQQTLPDTKYYLLNTPEKSDVSVHKRVFQKANVEVNLPDYLKQPYLVMQLGEHQLHYSHEHMWAQPLKTSIEQLLENSLPDRSITLIVNIEHFHATEVGKVIFSGQLLRLKGNESKDSLSEPFYLESKLNKDGYGEVVKEMKALLIELANKKPTE